MAPGKFEWNFRYLIFQIISVIGGWDISCELALRWMSLDLTDDKSTLVQVMAWCRQATSHYLSQCWPRSLCKWKVQLYFASVFHCNLMQVVEIQFDSLWPSDAVWLHRSESTLAHQWGLVTITWRQFHWRYLSHQSLKLAWKIIHVYPKI